MPPSLTLGETLPATHARRVCIAVPGLSGGGPAVNGPLLAGFLAEQGLETTLLVATGQEAPEVPVPPAVRIQRLGLDHVAPADRPARVLAEVDFGGLDALVTNTVSEVEAVIPALPDRLRVLGVVREDSPGEWYLLRAHARFLDGLVVVSPHLAPVARSLVPAGLPVHVVPNGLPPAGARAASRPGALDPVRLLYAGALDAKKGVLDLPALAAALRRRGVRFGLTVAGGRDEALERAFRRAGVADAVRSLPRLPRVELLAEMEASHVLVLPSRTEAFGMVLAEAMQRGAVPIAYAGAGGPRGIVRDGVDGFLVRTGDVGAMADRVQELAASPERFAALERAARERIDSCFSLERTGRRYLELSGEGGERWAGRQRRPGVLVPARKGIAWRAYGSLPAPVRGRLRTLLGRWPLLWRVAFLRLRR